MNKSNGIARHCGGWIGIGSIAVLVVLATVSAAQAQAPCPTNNQCNNSVVRLCANGPNVGKACLDDSQCAGAACRAAWQEFFIDAGEDITCIANHSANGGSGADGVDLADFDGDGDVDVVTGWEETGITFVYLNPCNPSNPFQPDFCNFPTSVRGEWTAVDVRGGAGTGGIEDAVFADFNLDGRPEGVATATEGTNKHVKIHGLTLDGSWLGESLPGTKHLYMQVRVGDIDGDGCADVVAGNKIARPSIYDIPPGCYVPELPEGTRCSLCPSNVICDETGGIWWWESPTGIDVNTGETACTPFGFNFYNSPPSIDTDRWNKRRIDKGFYWIMGLDLKDMDGDGDKDVLYSDRLEVGWFRNRTDEGNLAGWNAPIRIDTEQAILDRKDGTQFSSDEPFRFHAYGDVDGDGLEDVVVTASFHAGFCAIDQNRICKTNADCAAGDSCVNNGNRFAGYFYRRLNASGESWDIHPIFVKGGLPYGLDYKNDKVSKGVAIGDVTGNGRNELVFSVRGAGHALYMLTYDPAGPGQCGPCLNNEWNAYPISPCRKLSKYDNVQLADIDLDGRLDVVTSEENFAPGDVEEEAAGLGVVWYRNMGFCGNGVREEDEECDNGDTNGTFGQCCDTSCRLTKDNVCRNSSGAICDATEVCDGLRSSCPPDAVQVGMVCGGSSSPCSDMACNENGLCVPATDGQTCPDDGNPCTDDLCAGSACTHPFRLNELCEPGFGDPQCSSGVCRAFNNTISCQWVIANQGAPCGDVALQGPCDAPDTCDYGVCNPNYLPPQLCRAASGECEEDALCSGESPTCPPNEPKTGFSCTNDGNACTADICDDRGICIHPFRPQDWFCGAGGECTDRLCNGQGVCETVNVTASCTDDGDPCTSDICVDGVCEHLPRTGSDFNQCPDDGNPCTMAECLDGACINTPLVGASCQFDDGNPCTGNAACDANGECVAVPLPDTTWCGSQDSTECDMPDRCDGSGSCVDRVRPAGSVCRGGTDIFCDPGEVCDGVSRSCPQDVLSPAGTVCLNDGDLCTDDVCDGAGTCIHPSAADGTSCTNDLDECTADICMNGVCTHEIEDGLPCNTNDGDICIESACDAQGACVPFSANDGSVCGAITLCTSERCVNGGCLEVADVGKTCSNDFNICTDDVCDATGNCSHPPVTNGFECDDGNDCTLDDGCLDGSCTGDLAPAGTACGTAQAGECSEADVCDDLGTCLTRNAPDGQVCSADTLPCTSDECLNGRCVHIPQELASDGTSQCGIDFAVVGGDFSRQVRKLYVFDLGAGDELYAVGSFFSIGGQSIRSPARWEGQNWSQVGNSVAGGISSLAIFDDGNDLALYGAGSDNSGIPKVWKLVAGTWTAVPGFPTLAFGFTSVMAVYDDGNGAALHVVFTPDDAVTPIDVYKWDGTIWSTIGGGLWNPPGWCCVAVNDMVVFDDGNGSELFVAGSFAEVDGQAGNAIAKWDGLDWSPVGNLGNDLVNDLAIWNDGSGAALYAAGRLSGNDIKRLDANQWVDVGNVFSPSAKTLVGFDIAGLPTLVAGGVFTGLPGLDQLSYAAIWDGVRWAPLGICLNGSVETLAVFNDVAGDSVYLGGRFFDPTRQSPSYLARWSGAFGDTNNDTVVDLLEFRAFEQCLTGPSVGIHESVCGCSDLNGDGLVDQRDAALLWALIQP